MKLSPSLCLSGVCLAETSANLQLGNPISKGQKFSDESAGGMDPTTKLWYWESHVAAQEPAPEMSLVTKLTWDIPSLRRKRDPRADLQRFH